MRDQLAFGIGCLKAPARGVENLALPAPEPGTSPGPLMPEVFLLWRCWFNAPLHMQVLRMAAAFTPSPIWAPFWDAAFGPPRIGTPWSFSACRADSVENSGAGAFGACGVDHWRCWLADDFDVQSAGAFMPVRRWRGRACVRFLPQMLHPAYFVIALHDLVAHRDRGVSVSSALITALDDLAAPRPGPAKPLGGRRLRRPEYPRSRSSRARPETDLRENRVRWGCG